MPYDRTIASVREAMEVTFREVGLWCEKPETLRKYKPTSGGWSIDEILEHISLTNHFLMLTLTKYVEIAKKRARRGDPISDGESDLERLRMVGERGTFAWIRPVHMEPSGKSKPEEIRTRLRDQAAECLQLLEQLKNGEGSLCRVQMTVNDLGKIDLYQWLYFLVQHARRHLQQMTANQSDYHLPPLNSEPTTDIGIAD